MKTFPELLRHRRRAQRFDVLVALLALYAVCNLSAQPNPAAAAAPSLAVTNASQTNTLAQNGLAGSVDKHGANLLTAGSTNSMEGLDDKHKLAIGDRLSFKIIEDEEAPKQLVVTDSGDLEAPHIGRFPAVGKSCKELAKALKAELEKEYYYRATVIVAVDQKAKSRGKVYLVGPVRVPGPQEIPSDEVFTLSKAILRAGGFNDFADRTNVRVTRKKALGVPDEIFIANVTLILEKGLTGLDIPLEPGDFIYVPERSIRF